MFVLKRQVLVALFLFCASCAYAAPQAFTVIAPDHAQLRLRSQQTIQAWLYVVQAVQSGGDRNAAVRAIATLMQDRPYLYVGAEGEGDACVSGALQCSPAERKHIQQDPVYRTDGFNCQTMVQTTLALLNAKTRNDFWPTLLSIEYGGGGAGQTVRFFNRNHFTSLDFNPINEQHHFLKNSTTTKYLHLPIKTTQVIIDKMKWFAAMRQPNRLHDVVRVLTKQDGPAMVKRFKADYPKPFKTFAPQTVSLSYIPKAALMLRTKSGYTENSDAINQLPTPAVVEIVRDPAQWLIGGKPIATIIGSALNVSHLGLLYRQHFAKDELIYQRITMRRDDAGNKQATVTPQYCRRQGGCSKVMMLNASDAFANGFHYTADSAGHYHCTAAGPKSSQTSTSCNRVYALPLADYLASYHYDRFTLMDNPSVLGIHLEKIL